MIVNNFPFNLDCFKEFATFRIKYKIIVVHLRTALNNKVCYRFYSGKKKYVLNTYLFQTSSCGYFCVFSELKMHVIDQSDAKNINLFFHDDDINLEVVFY